ncbi:MAG: EamA family transporter [Chloracidobacterium sp.]|nr:EamA family transporter [Chloracidobacterium sp.]MCC6824958.1 EamA family transporter [Acidobacteriota bacterium]MCO5333227.1 DMT family transporter [Pyrinomonadaceae bacterium]
MIRGSKNAFWLVIAAVLIWSTGGLLIKLTALDAYQVTFFRSLLAGLTVLIVMRKEGLRINAFGLLCSLFYAGLLFLFVWATKHTTAANAIFLQYTAPIYILILAPFVIRERFHLRDLITVVLCIIGMSLFFVGKLEISDYSGNIAALGSGICLGLYIMLLKHPAFSTEKENAAGRRGAAPVATVVYGNLLLAIVMLPSGIGALPVMTTKDVFAVAFLGIVQIGISYILFIKGISGGTRPIDASIIGFVEPLLNPVWVFLFIGEQPSNWALLGGAIIIATVLIHTIRQYRTPVAGAA